MYMHETTGDEARVSASLATNLCCALIITWRVVQKSKLWLSPSLSSIISKFKKYCQYCAFQPLVILRLLPLTSSLSVIAPLLPRRLSATPTLIWPGVVLLWLTTVVDHALDVRTIFKILVKPANRACDFLVLMRCQRNERDEAYCEERPTSNASSRPVATVAALSCYVLCSLEVIREFCDG